MHQVNQVLGGLDKVGMREFLESRDEVGVTNSPLRKMTVGVKRDSDRDIRPDFASNPFQEVTLAIQTILGDHSAMQTQEDNVDRCGKFQFPEQLITKEFPRLLVDGPARFGPSGRPLDEVPAEDSRPGAVPPERSRCTMSAFSDARRQARRNRP